MAEAVGDHGVHRRLPARSDALTGAGDRPSPAPGLRTPPGRSSSRSARGQIGAAALVAPLVVDEEEVAERPVNDVEAQVRAPLAGVGVVLQQRVDEHLRVEVVVDAAGDQLDDEAPVDRSMSLICRFTDALKFSLTRTDGPTV